MGNYNIQRLKKKIGFKKDNNEVDIYFELIDRIYYQNESHSEEFNEKTEVTTWAFNDGCSISLDIPDVTNLALFLLNLYYDADEQIMSLYDLEKSCFLKENEL